jgi:hypothetical protein
MPSAAYNAPQANLIPQVAISWMMTSHINTMTQNLATPHC